MKTIEQKVIKFIYKHHLVDQGDKLLIALSGGADSVFALSFFHKYAKLFGCTLSAYHLNHMLRGKEAEEDELFCRSLCRRLNIELFSEKRDVKTYAHEESLSLEEAARIIRYEHLERVRKENGIDKVITAHNMSDNTETILFNLFKGTGIDGLAGIPVIRGNLIRPLLALTKEEIRGYLDTAGQEFRIDSTNLKNEFQRNFIRNEIVPRIREKINPKLDEALFRNSVILRDLQSDIREDIIVLYNKYVEKSVEHVDVNLALFEEVNQMKSGLVIKRIFEEDFDTSYSYEDYEKTLAVIQGEPGSEAEYKSTIKAIRERDYLRFYKREDTDSIEEIVIKPGEEKVISGFTVGIEEVCNLPDKFSSDRKIEYISLDDIGESLIIRVWKPGDSFSPLGGKGTKNISEFLTDEKVDSFLKKKQLVLCDRNNIVWVVGLRLDNKYKITNKTRRIGKLWMK